MIKKIQFIVPILLLVISQFSYSQGSVASDKAVLQKLFTALKGSQWTKKNNWNSSKPLQDWEGVWTDANGRVTHLYLYDRNLEGSIPPEIGDLDKLEKLHLERNNNISGNIPLELGQLKNLLTLNLSRNSLTGSIPKTLGDLNYLEHLNVSENSLSGSLPKELSQLTNLIQFDLENNQFSGEIPKEYGLMSSLESLVLNSNRLTGSIPAELGNLSNLTILRMRDNQLSGLIPLPVANFQFMYIDQNLFLFEDMIHYKGPYYDPQNSVYDSSYTVYGSPGDSIRLSTSASDPNNRYRWYHNGVIITGAKSKTYDIPSYSTADSGYYQVKVFNKNFESYKQLVIWGDSIFVKNCDDRCILMKLYEATNDTGNTGNTWSDATNWGTTAPLNTWKGIKTDANGRVTEIDLQNNNLKGLLISEIGNLDELKYLNLGVNQLGDSIPASIGELNKLEQLLLARNNFSGNIPSELGQLTLLEDCYLEENNLSGSIPKELGNLNKLQVLSLSDNQLSGSIPNELTNASALTALHLGMNQLSGSIPSDIDKLTKLEKIFLQKNQLTGIIPSTMTNLIFLKYLDLSFNQLTDTIPIGLGFSGVIAWVVLNDNLLSGQVPFDLIHVPLFTLQNNYFLFEDFEHYGPSGPIKSPQWSTYDSIEFKSFSTGQPMTLTCSASDPDNNYQWYYNNSILSGATNKDLVIPAFSSADSGTYTLKITNSRLNFSLWREPIYVTPCDDRCILWKLYEYTNEVNPVNDRWIEQYNWGDSGPLEDWFGVTTNADGRVTHLNFYANNLKGELPEELGYLSELEELDFRNNYLFGQLPPTFGQLKKLKKLDLTNNDFTGNFPLEMYDLPVLESLTIKNNWLSGSLSDDIKKLQSLVLLDLVGNQLNGNIPDSITTLKNLEFLTLADNSFQQSIPVEIGDLKSLIKIDLSDNDLSGSIPSSIGNLTSLTSFRASHNDLSGDVPTEIGNLDSLNELNLSFNRLKGEFPASVQNMSAIRNIYIHQNEFSGLPDAMKNMSFFLVNVTANKLKFEDMDGITATMFDYIQQDTMYTGNTIQYGHKWRKDTLHIPGAVMANNRYQWYKNDTLIPGATDSIFVIDTVLLNREGKYHAEVTNVSMPGLMLLRDTIRFFVDPVTLPVTLVDLKVVNHLGDALVKWSTLSEINASHFIVQRSIDGKTWQELGSVSACGTCSELIQYRFVDQNPYKGSSYYSIVQYDNNGDVERFGPVPFVLEQKRVNRHVRIYPTITNGRIHVEMNNNVMGKSIIQLWSAQGKIIKEWTMMDNWNGTIDLGHSIANGVYTLVVQNGQFIESVRLVKNP